MLNMRVRVWNTMIGPTIPKHLQLLKEYRKLYASEYWHLFPDNCGLYRLRNTIKKKVCFLMMAGELSLPSGFDLFSCT